MNWCKKYYSTFNQVEPGGNNRRFGPMSTPRKGRLVHEIGLLYVFLQTEEAGLYGPCRVGKINFDLIRSFKNGIAVCLPTGTEYITS